MYELAPGIPYYEGEVASMAVERCAHAWITSGEDIRTTCMRELAREPSARQAYVAAEDGFEDLIDMFDQLFGCSHVQNATHEELAHIFIEAEQPLEAHLSFDNSNGMFFHSENQKTWIESSLLGQELLELNEFIDAHTRVFKVFLVTRDLAVDSLFYSLLRIQFNLKADGSVTFSYQSIFSPIVQFTYGMEGYDWFFREVIICEVLFAALFAIFFYREVSQLVFGRIGPAVKAWREPENAQVVPSGDDSVMPKKEVNFDEEKNDSVTTVTSFSENDCSTRSASGALTGTPPEVSAILELHTAEQRAEARDARSQRAFVERMKSMGDSVWGLDVNGNGIDDIDEIKEMIEDYLLPDAKGWADILDWVTIATITAAIIHRVYYIIMAIEIHDLFLHLKDGENFNHVMEDIVDDFEELDHIVHSIRVISLFIVIIGLIQFFRYLAFDRRFAIVTDTIVSSAVDLIPVLGIFSVVCISYAVMGTAIYGQDLLDFADIGSSLSSLFLMILGQFEGYYDSKFSLISPTTCSIGSHFHISLCSGGSGKIYYSTVLLELCHHCLFHSLQHGVGCHIHGV